MDQDMVKAFIKIAGLKKKSPIRKNNERLIKKYIESGLDLKLIITVINAHIGVKSTDKEFLKEVDKYGRPMLLVLNKADKVKDEDKIRETIFMSKLALKELKNVLPAIHLVSSKTNFGISELGSYLSTLFLFTEEEELAKTKLEQLADYSTSSTPLLISQ